MGFEQALVARAQVSEETLAYARAASQKVGTRLAATIVRLGLADEDQIAAAFRDACDLPALTSAAIPGASNVTLNPRFLRRHAAAVIGEEEGRLHIAVADPEDEELVEGLTFATDLPILTSVATFSQIEDLHKALTGDDDLQDIGTDIRDDFARLADGDSDAPVIRRVQSMLDQAAQRRASDVHIEPMARHVIVRFRIDGRLVEAERLPLQLAQPIASRIKVMAALDIAETRLPQDGRIRLTSRGRDIDVRVSTSPTAFGESIVLRLLGQSAVPLDLERLGLPVAAHDKLLRALDRPHGIILLTGPTGSGKTTTLYAALSRLRRPEVKILTVEDPVEVLLEGVNQVQVRPEIGLSYADTLRAFLRQDPDILMIGEIRDKETAEIALRAALTGHLVLSTLHTNSTLGAFTRLTDIGIEPYLAASTVNAVIAQRLIRTLCMECAAQRPLQSDEAIEFQRAGLPIPKTVGEPVGCPVCQQTGFKGRAPLIEVLEVDADLRDVIREGRAEAIANATPASETLLGHGLALIASGRTTLAEVQRAVQAD
jgi:general secretion pathway protein E